MPGMNIRPEIFGLLVITESIVYRRLCGFLCMPPNCTAEKNQPKQNPNVGRFENPLHRRKWNSLSLQALLPPGQVLNSPPECSLHSAIDPSAAETHEKSEDHSYDLSFQHRIYELGCRA
jgi:hypothetical protein